MAKHALDGLNVLDLSRDVGGSYCTKMLADLGATVLMIEPPDGHPLRAAGPFPGDQPSLETSGLFLYLCSNKGSMVQDLESPKGRQLIMELARDADIVVESFKPGKLATWGLDYETLKQGGHDDLILTSVTPYGQTGRWRDWESEEIVAWALSGYLYFGGDPNREPLMVHDHQALMHAGAHAAYASLSALWWARKTGLGQHVDVSAFEATLTAHIWTTTSWTQEGIIMRREGSDVIECKDGWIHFLSLAMNPNFFLLLDRPELMDEPRFADRGQWAENQVEVVAMLEEWAKSHSKIEAWQRAQELRIPCAPVFDAKDLGEAANLKERGFLLEMDHPKAGKVLMPGFPYIFSETSPSLRRPAPTLGEDIEGWPTERRNRASTYKVTTNRSPVEPDPCPERPLPLQGIRILEITNNWAGPVAGRNLSDLGAEIIKIESPTRIAARMGHFTGQQAFRIYYNRCSYNNSMNRGKYGITLDLAQPEGRDLFLEMVKESDVVIENNSPRVMHNLNLSYEILRKVNSQLIMLQISAYGQTGPLKDYIAYGANIEAACGLAAVTGYSDDPRPYRTGYFYADPVTATHASLAIMAALHHRESTGNGQHIDFSLQENGIAFFPEAFLEWSLRGRLMERRGNRHRIHAPQGCYPSKGTDSWVAICIRSDAEWDRFCDLAEDPRLRNPRFATEDNRRINHDEIDSLIREWSNQWDHNEAAEALQHHGIPAAPVLANWEMVSNLHAYDRGFYVTVPQRSMGAFPSPGIVWKFSETPGEIRMPSADYGEHNHLVMSNLLKLTNAEIDKLSAKRVIAAEPPPEWMVSPFG